MPVPSKPKPPNAFSWYARYIADQRRDQGRPFRSPKAAIHEAALLWEKLTPEEKMDWKEKARSEKVRFRLDPELCTMTPKEFIAQGCELSTNGMVGNSNFWSRHWAATERQQHADELDLMEHFDTRKRPADRQTLETNWIWKYGDNRDALLSEQFLFISVQSSSPVEADNYVPETLAIAQFSAQEGIVPYSEFSCAFAPDDEWTTATRRGGASYGENYVGDEDGCQARVGMQAVAKLVFQRAKIDTTTQQSPIFFCLADEFEVVYDVLCDLKVRATAKSQSEQRRFSVKQLATCEDLVYCLLKWRKIELPPVIGGLQEQLYFDKLIERSDPGLVAGLRCGAHESDAIIRCPLSVIRLAALKIKVWLDNRGIPESDVSLIERQAGRQFDWPVFSDQELGSRYQDSDDEQDEGGASISANRRVDLTAGSNVDMGKLEMTIAWVNSQGKSNTYAADSPSARVSEAVGVSNDVSAEVPAAPYVQDGDGAITNGRAGGMSQSNHLIDGAVDGHSIHGAVDGHSIHGPVDNRSIHSAVENRSPIRGQLEDHSARGQALRVQNGAPNGLRRLCEIASASRRRVGAGTELENQHLLPFGARGIGRGLHLVPAYVNDLQVLSSLLDV